MRAFLRVRVGPALLALFLALLGAAGWGPPMAGPGGRTVAVVDLSASCEPPAPTPAGALTFDDSDLGAALRRAAGAARIRLYTDGCDASGAVPDLPGPPVDVVLRPRRDELLLLGLRAPERVAPGADFSLDVVVGRTAGAGTAPAVARVEVERDGGRLGGVHAARLERGQSRTIRLRDRLDRPGLVRYRARLGAQERQVALLVGDKPAIYAPGVETLEGFEVVAEFHERVDAVLLAGALPPRPMQERIAAAVRGGAGLLVSGGARLAGGPLEPALPLTDRPPEGRATLLLLDFSGSMEPRKEELRTAVAALREWFTDEDRVAGVLFREEVAKVFGWSDGRDVAWDLRSSRAHGNTRLAPALRRARSLLADAKGETRVFVVSDGEWRDPPGAIADALRLLPGAAYRAALFVSKEAPAASWELFAPNAFLSTADLARDLEAIERGAADRWLGRVEATRGAGPLWLEGAVPAGGAIEGNVRLYARGEGEHVPLRAAEAPLVGAWRRGGKVVVTSSPRIDPLPLLRAVVRDDGGVRLEARRAPDGVVVDVAGSDAPVFVDSVEVAARPAGPGLRRARVAGSFPGAVEIRCGPALALLPPAASREQQGLFPRVDIAAGIAARSGGRLYEEMPDEDPAPPSAAARVTLLAAAVLVLLGAALRRGG